MQLQSHGKSWIIKPLDEKLNNTDCVVERQAKPGALIDTQSTERDTAKSFLMIDVTLTNFPFLQSKEGPLTKMSQNKEGIHLKKWTKKMT